ncbi:small cardioactive peptide [Plakobranchus ocellatus]|uniref:Small cardioactive peptide n=1 Tax=Plakobranchus ocellatus TaxID=259542 RepID=A0AAV4BN55_9GAST|nr:small cardioactive peptide [Plakobranchus ocellatus]
MGVPDDMEGPPRKKPKLSLAIRRREKDQQMTPEAGGCSDSKTSPPVLKEEDSHLDPTAIETNSTETVDLTAESPPAPDAFVPPVASFHNLGNTCFMNSMLQVLRYTPAFLPGLAALREEIHTLEEELEKAEDDDAESLLSLETRRTWGVVKNIHMMYEEMDQLEGKHVTLPTSDAAHMAVRPTLVLNSIRELNPMFEGNFQHDAQEFLRCLLCYMEDAERDVRKLKSRVINNKKGAMNKQVTSDRLRKREDNLRKSNEAQREVTRASNGNGLEAKTPTKATDPMDGQAGVEEGAQGNNVESPKKQFKLKGGASSSKTALRKVSAENRRSRGKNSSSKDVKTSERKGMANLDCNGIGGTVDDAHLALKPSRGRKRKRSRSQSVKQDECNGEECGKFTSSAIKTGHETKSAALARSLKQGMAATKKAVGNGQTIVGLFKKIAEKLTPGPGAAVRAEQRPANRVEAAESENFLPPPGIMSLTPLKQTRRLGMNGHVFRQTKDKTSSGEDEKHKKHGNNKNIEEVAEKKRYFPVSPNKNSVKSEEEKLNDLESSQPRQSYCPEKSLQSASTSSRVSMSPIKSPHSVEASDEITPASETDVAMDMESTIDSVTKKYYSTLSRPALRHASPLQSSSVPASPDTRAEDVKFDVSADSGECMRQNQSSPSCSKNSPSSSLLPRMSSTDVIIHSPNKWGRESHTTKRQSKAVKAIDFDAEKNSCGSFSVLPMPKSSHFPPTNLSDLLNFFPKRVRQVSESQSISELRSSLLYLNRDGAVLRSSRSAPNSPKIKPDKEKSLDLPISMVKRNCALSQNSLTDSVPESGMEVEEDKCQPVAKIELKRCDWLGVSPVKSVSASLALRNIRRQQEKALSANFGDVSKVRGKIVFDCTFQDKKTSKADTEPEPAVNSSKGISNCDKLTGESGLKCDTESDPLLQTRRKKVSLRTTKYQASAVRKSSPKRNHQGAEMKTFNIVQSSKATSSGSSTILAVQRASEAVGETTKIYCPKELQLKPVSISINKCDWMFPSSIPSTSSPGQSSPPRLGQRVMVNGKVRVKRIKSTAQNKCLQSSSQGSKQSEGIKQEDMGNKSSSPLTEQLFGGTMVHMTRCLECERSKERKEAFLDISVAVKHHKDTEAEDSCDEEEDENADNTSAPPSCLASLIQLSSTVERLRESNKYWCEDCLHHVEAERSCHYLDMPQILSLHLKRFSATSGLLGGVSKLNDKVMIPDELPCLRRQCRDSCKDLKHRYCLFALATHSGTSILHGHYRAYVKVQPWVSPDVFHNLLVSHWRETNHFENYACSGSTAEHSSYACASSPSQTSQTPQHEQAEPVAKARISNCSQNAELVDGVGDNSESSSSTSLPNSKRDWAVSGATGKEGARSSCRTIGDFFTCDRVLSSKSRPLGGDEDQGSRSISSPRKLSSSANSDKCLREKHNPPLSPSKGANQRKEKGPRDSNCNEFLKDQVISSGDCKPEVKREVEGTGREEGVKRELESSGREEGAGDGENPRCFWLECDDECVRVMDEEEFGQKLREENGALLGTPYVLFYHAQGMVSP